MLASSFNLSQSFNYTPYLFYENTVQIRDQFFLYMNSCKNWAKRAACMCVCVPCPFLFCPNQSGQPPFLSAGHWGGGDFPKIR